MHIDVDVALRADRTNGANGADGVRDTGGADGEGVAGTGSTNDIELNTLVIWAGHVPIRDGGCALSRE